MTRVSMSELTPATSLRQISYVRLRQLLPLYFPPDGEGETSAEKKKEE